MMSSCLQIVNEENKPYTAELSIPKEYEVFQSFRVGFGPGNALGVLADSGKQTMTNQSAVGHCILGISSWRIAQPTTASKNTSTDHIESFLVLSQIIVPGKYVMLFELGCAVNQNSTCRIKSG